MKVVHARLTKKYILSKIREEEIFERYLGITPDLNEVYANNVLRQDENPGCTFYIRNTDSRLIFNDHAWKQFDCFDVVMQLECCNFQKALRIIANDFGILTDNLERISRTVSIDKTIKPKTIIKIKSKPYTKQEIQWWCKGGLTFTEEELLTERVYSISAYAVMVGDDLVEHRHLTMAFAYYCLKGRYQIYFPTSTNKKKKFRNSPDLKICDLDYLRECQYVIITKSKKDCIYLRKLGVNACYVINEKVKLDEETLQYLRSKYSIIFTLFDNDWTGKKQSVRYMRLYKTLPLMFSADEKKDLTDNLVAYGYITILDIIEDLLQRYNLRL